MLYCSDIVLITAEFRLMQIPELGLRDTGTKDCCQCLGALLFE